MSRPLDTSESLRLSTPYYARNGSVREPSVLERKIQWRSSTIGSADEDERDILRQLMPGQAVLGYRECCAPKHVIGAAHGSAEQLTVWPTKPYERLLRSEAADYEAIRVAHRLYDAVTSGCIEIDDASLDVVSRDPPRGVLRITS